MSASLPLFRKEVLEERGNTLVGSVVLATPVPQWLTAVLFGSIAVCLVTYICLGEYTRKARASGYVVPDRGLIKIYPQQVGSLREVRVSDGQRVSKGTVLAVVSTERVGSFGDAQAEIAKQLASRRSSLIEEKEKLRAIYEAQSQSNATKLRHYSGEVDQVSAAIEVQKQRVRLGEAILERHTLLSEQKFVSEGALTERKVEVLEQRGRLADLERSLSGVRRELKTLQAEQSLLPLRHDKDVASINRTMAELTAGDIENEARRELHVIAPQAGVVTAINAAPGKAATTQAPLMSLIPDNASLQAELYVPTRAAGFVRAGSSAKLQYQAFPYQKFGLYEGRVMRVSKTAVPAAELPFPPGPGEAFYVVTVALRDPFVVAYGRREPLQVGMQLDADVELDRRTLIEWIFEPLLGFSGRML